MEDPMDCLIDWNSPVPCTTRTSLVAAFAMNQKSPALHDVAVPPLHEENNPFDMMVWQTEINEADRNDPFEIAAETARGFCAKAPEFSAISTISPQKLLDRCTDVAFVKSVNMPIQKPIDTPKKSDQVLSVKSVEKSSGKPVQVPSDIQALNESIDKVPFSLDELNLDDIQPPEFLVNSSLDSFDNDSMNDILNLSAMSDIKMTPRQTKSFLHGKGDDLCLGESAASLKRKCVSSNEHVKRVVSPIDFPSRPLKISEKSGSFEESPIKVLCELKSEESVKTLIESRIQKCIAKALNDSHQQLRCSSLFDAIDTSLVANQAKSSNGNMRASLSVPLDLHLLHLTETCTKPEQSWDVTSPSKLLEELTIPVLDKQTEAKRRSFSTSVEVTSKPESLAAQTDVQSASAMSEEKISRYREIVKAQLQPSEGDTARRSSAGGTESKSKGHRRSLSCDVLPQAPLPTKGSSPPKLPPLPLSSETIRDLNLCSKYSPPKSNSPGNRAAALRGRTNSVPAYAQPKLVLKKKLSVAGSGPLTATETFGGSKRGPLKAVLPVKIMTRFTGSPRPSTASTPSQARRGSLAASRTRPSGSPSMEKTKLHPLAASTPSTATVVDNPGATRGPPVMSAPSPRRAITSGIPSPSKRVSSASSSSAPNSKADTPTRRTMVSAYRYARNGNPRVLLDKNSSLTSPTAAPVTKPGIQTDGHIQSSKGHSQTLGKENMVCP